MNGISNIINNTHKLKSERGKKENDTGINFTETQIKTWSKMPHSLVVVVPTSTREDNGLLFGIRYHESKVVVGKEVRAILGMLTCGCVVGREEACEATTHANTA